MPSKHHSNREKLHHRGDLDPLEASLATRRILLRRFIVIYLSMLLGFLAFFTVSSRGYAGLKAQIDSLKRDTVYVRDSIKLPDTLNYDRCSGIKDSLYRIIDTLTRTNRKLTQKIISSASSSSTRTQIDKPELRGLNTGESWDWFNGIKLSVSNIDTTSKTVTVELMDRKSKRRQSFVLKEKESKEHSNLEHAIKITLERLDQTKGAYLKLTVLEIS